MFHVPEKSRVTDPTFPLTSDASYGNNGYFTLPSPSPGWELIVVASDEGLNGSIPWEHVSVSAIRKKPPALRIPNWTEMCFVKDIFWDGEDVVIQYHPRKSEYVNQHPGVLHMWRPVGVELPTPPSEMVGMKTT